MKVELPTAKVPMELRTAAVVPLAAVDVAVDVAAVAPEDVVERPLVVRVKLNLLPMPRLQQPKVPQPTFPHRFFL
jgi:hypothetical protein